MSKHIGYIDSVRFGRVGYQDCQFGLALGLLSDGIGTTVTITGGWSCVIECTEHSKWTEDDRSAQHADMVRKVDKILRDASVMDVRELLDVPIEMEFDGMKLKDWRILSEAIR